MMRRHEWPPAESGRGAGVEPAARVSLLPDTGGLLRELQLALSGAAPDQRLAIGEWLAGRGLLIVAREADFRHAAHLAYRAADVLAGAVR